LTERIVQLALSQYAARALDGILEDIIEEAHGLPPKQEVILEAIRRDIKDQIGDRSGKANDAKIKAAGEALTTKFTDVEGEIYQYRNRSGQDPLNFPIKLNNKLAALQGIVESGDYRPTDQSYAVFKDLSAQLETQFRRLDQLIEGELAAFNQQIVKKKLQPIVPKK
jgi:hypothetical protein